MKEGDSVAVGDLLVRFDPRDAETRLQAARRKRSQLQSQIAINRVVLGEQDEAELTANQQRQLETQRRKFNSDNIAARSRPWPAAAPASIGLRQSLETAENITLRFNRLLQDGAASEMQALKQNAG